MKSPLLMSRLEATRPPDIDLRAGREHHARRVDQEDLAVGAQRAEDGRGTVADDAVQRNGRGAGLHELHGLAGADVEALPVEHGLVAGLVDHHGVGRRGADAGLAGHHLRAFGQGGGPGRHSRQQRREQLRQTTAAADAVGGRELAREADHHRAHGPGTVGGVGEGRWWSWWAFGKVTGLEPGLGREPGARRAVRVAGGGLAPAWCARPGRF